MKTILRHVFLISFAGLAFTSNAAQFFQRKLNQWKDNKYEGLWISWSDSLKKNVESRGRYKNGQETGTWKFYYDDGTLRRRERYSRHGIATKYFYPNGKLKSKGKARLDYEEEFLHYYYQGDWTYYSEEGKPVQVITYDRGVETKSRFFGESK